MDRKDAIEEMHSQFGTSELVTALNYYGIKNDGRSRMVCPFHGDKEYGNAYFGKTRGKGKCFRCGKTFDIIDLVKHFEPQLDKYYDQVEFAYGTILGRQIPDYSRSSEKPFLRKSELEMIGLPFAMGEYIKVPTAMCFRMDKSSPLERSAPDEEDIVTLYSRIRTDSIYDMYKEDPKGIKNLLYNKADESIRKQYDFLKDLSGDTEIGRISKEFPDLAAEKRMEINNTIKTLKKIKKKILFLRV